MSGQVLVRGNSENHTHIQGKCYLTICTIWKYIIGDLSMSWKSFALKFVLDCHGPQNIEMNLTGHI